MKISNLEIFKSYFIYPVQENEWDLRNKKLEESVKGVFKRYISEEDQELSSPFFDAFKAFNLKAKQFFSTDVKRYITSLSDTRTYFVKYKNRIKEQNETFKSLSKKEQRTLKDLYAKVSTLPFQGVQTSEKILALEKLKEEELSDYLTFITFKFEILNRIAKHCNALIKYRSSNYEVTRNQKCIFHLPELEFNFFNLKSQSTRAITLQLWFQKLDDKSTLYIANNKHKLNEIIEEARNDKSSNEDEVQEIKELCSLILNQDTISSSSIKIEKLDREICLYFEHFLPLWQDKNFPISEIEKKILNFHCQQIKEKFERFVAGKVLFTESLLNPSHDVLIAEAEQICKWYKDTLPSQIEEFQTVWNILNDKKKLSAKKIAFFQTKMGKKEYLFPEWDLVQPILLNRPEFIKTAQNVIENYKKRNSRNIEQEKELEEKIIDGLEVKKAKIVKPKQKKTKKSHKRNQKKNKTVLPYAGKLETQVPPASAYEYAELNFGKTRKFTYQIQQELMGKFPDTNPITYHERIWDWYRDEPNQLKNASYINLSPEEKEIAKTRHAISPLFQLLWNSDYALPYTFTDAEGNSYDAKCIAGTLKRKSWEQKVIYVLCGSHHQYAHLCNDKFLETVGNIKDNVKNTFFEYEHPDLKQMQEINNFSTQSPISQLFESCEILRQGPCKSLIIENKNTHTTYTLYKPFLSEN